LSLTGFFLKIQDEGLEQQPDPLNVFALLAEDPDHGALGLVVVQGLQVLANNFDDELVLEGVLAEEVSAHDYTLLHHLVHFGLHQLDQHLHALVGRRCQLQRHLRNGAHSFAHELDVDFVRVLLQFVQDRLHVQLVDQE